MRKILLGLKNRTDLKILKKFLKEEKFETILYDYENSERIDENVDLIIIDEFCAEKCIEKIKELKSSQKVFLPAVCLISHKIKSEPFLKTGFDDVIRYPSSKSEFLARIKNLLKMREQSERVLRGSEKMFKSLFETANDAIFIMEGDKFIDCNLKTLEMFACKKEEIIGETPYDKFSPPFQPDERKSKGKALEKIRLAYEGVPQRFEWKHKKLNGEEFDTEVSLNSLEIDDKKYLIAIVRDITERKSLISRLQENEEKYRLIVEKSHAGILLVDDNYKFVYVNDRLCEMLGRERDEIIFHDFRGFLAEDSKELVADRYVRRQRGEKLPERYEFNIVRKNGEIRNVEIISTVIQDSMGKKFTMAQLLDVTERKRAEEKIKKYVKRLEILYDLNLAITQVRPLKEICEIALEKIKNFMDYHSGLIFLIDYKTQNLNIVKVISKVEVAHLVEGKNFPAIKEYIEKLKIGEILILKPQELEGHPLLPLIEKYGLKIILSVPLAIKGKFTGVLSLLWDEHKEFKKEEIEFLKEMAKSMAIGIHQSILVEELKEYTQKLEKIVEKRTEKLAESEKRYRTLVESPLVAFWEADANGNFTFVNKRLVEMAGYDSEDEIVGKLNMADCIVPEQKDWLLRRMELHRKGKLYVEIVEAKLLKKDGSTFNVLVSPAPIYDEQGNFVKVVGAMIDISDRKRVDSSKI